MFSKILIANRGEIACRIIATLRRMGIAGVAVYSEADARARHVRLADEAVAIGPAPAAESYLDADAVLAAARASGAEAIHPGYGFLAENAAFAQAVADAGMSFIGPPPAAIAAMGDKIEAKRLAEAAGVPTIPGFDGPLADAEAAAQAAAGLGYPVMLKASAGGGGKGMRLATDEAGLREGFARAQGEARSSFGDDRLFLERFIEEPRHVEIQVLADSHGGTVHLGERECSIQRRHQKVIEEAPSPGVDESLRAAMGAQAVALARAVGYVSAGTVEFILDRDRDFYFLEMNTRLQVEHPVTEFVTGLDLVEQMIRIAAGEPLGFGQDQVGLDGWAVEARVYAEDPYRGFLPSVGRLVRYREPAVTPALRIDSGVAEGSEISVHYDPLVAKVIAHAPDRATAVTALARALDRFVIRGVEHNIPFLGAVLAHPRFTSGRLSTAFIDQAYPDGFAGAKPTPEMLTRLILAAALIGRRVAEAERAISGRLDGLASAPAEGWSVRLDDTDHPIALAPAAGGYDAQLEDGATHRLETEWRPGQALLEAGIDGEPVAVQVERAGAATFRLGHGGLVRTVRVLAPHAAHLAAEMPAKVPADLSRFLLSPMPGLLVSVNVARGQEVKAGEVLAVVEAMKMENVLRAVRDGTVANVHAQAGDSLAVDQTILEFA